MTESNIDKSLASTTRTGYELKKQKVNKNHNFDHTTRTSTGLIADILLELQLAALSLQHGTDSYGISIKNRAHHTYRASVCYS